MALAHYYKVFQGPNHQGETMNCAPFEKNFFRIAESKKDQRRGKRRLEAPSSSDHDMEDSDEEIEAPRKKNGVHDAAAQPTFAKSDDNWSRLFDRLDRMESRFDHRFNQLEIRLNQIEQQLGFHPGPPPQSPN